MIRSRRIGLVHLVLALFALALLGKAAHVQLAQRERWAARAQRQQVAERPLPAPRGDILDASGAVLAQSRAVVRLAIAPREVRDRARLARLLRIAGVSGTYVKRATDPGRRWVQLPGRFVADDVARLMAMRGVHATAERERVYAVSEGTRPLIGSVGRDGNGSEGLELALDSLLAGRAGAARMVRDARGRSHLAPGARKDAPTPGHSVTLTLNRELQEIAERALADAMAKMGADGGDIVMLEPSSGEVRAMASRRAGVRVSAATALTEPFEPGSTLKPFIAAALLAQGRAQPDDSIAVFGGEYTINGRTLRDVHRGESMMTLAEVLQWSSNVGIARFAERLTPREQYEALRDFGFGTPTGVPFPSEASGRLRTPAEWSKQSAASLAIGYEISVTPLQLAVAYAAFANGGRLLEPALVKEIRAADGTVVFRHTPRVARQVIPPSVASQLRSMLVAVVEQGSAVQADIETYLLAGKTGTARRNVGGRYAATQYYATFVGLFPAEDPQFVILVKLDSPQGAYYGGTTAAPVTRAVLEAALAARDAALDRRALAALPRRERADSTRPDSVMAVTRSGPTSPVALAGEERVAAPAPAARSRSGAANVPFVATLPYHPPRPAARPPRAVPVVAGLELRDAVRALHEAGFRVRLAGNGPRGTTQPAAGTLVPAGALIRLYHALE